MPRWLPARPVSLKASLATLRARGGAAARRAWRALRHRRTPVEVLVADPVRRRALERELRTGLARLERALGAPLPPEAAVLVQQVIPGVVGERPLAGCYQTGLRPDGRRYARLRLALEVSGRALGADELLAVLAEQCLGLADQEGTLAVLVPVELPPPPPPAASAEGPRVLRADPLAPPTPFTPRIVQPNGHAPTGGRG